MVLWWTFTFPEIALAEAKVGKRLLVVGLRRGGTGDVPHGDLQQLEPSLKHVLHGGVGSVPTHDTHRRKPQATATATVTAPPPTRPAPRGSAATWTGCFGIV